MGRIWDWLGRLLERRRLARANRPRKRTWKDRAQVFVSYGPAAAVKAEGRHAVTRVRSHRCQELRADGSRCPNPVMVGSEGHALTVCWIHRDAARPDVEDEEELERGNV